MLCLDCEKLGLSPEKFQCFLDRGSTALEPDRYNLKSSHKLKRKVKRNGGCQFCKLIYESIKDTDGQNVDDETECLIEWVMDGQQVASTQRYGTVSRRIRISWGRSDQVNGPKVKEREELYFLYVPSLNLKRPSTDTKSLLDEETDALAQVYKGDIYAWIKSWINLCEKNHQNAYAPIEDKDRKAFRDLVRETWFCVVDVENMNLTNLKLNDEEQPEPHVALSYVWGTEHKSDHRTLLSNVMQRKQKGCLIMDDLPLTIQDAIRLVKDLALGIRYIWIDSLCISQDSLMSWRFNAENMHLIFGNAYFTICAADGDSGAGLRAINPETKHIPMKGNIKEDLELLVSSSPESVIQASRWSTRGWTFQERILSRRCLIFAGDRIFLQCRLNNYDDNGMSWSSDWRKSPLSTLRDLEDRPMWFYMTCVELYTGRNLTKSVDILKAFNGVSRVIEEHLCAPFFFGLPSSHFDFAILWRPKSGKERRRVVPEKDAEFPSWSWSGWQDTDAQKGTAAYYPPDILEGCLLSLHDWLINHTWIVWYIRDGNGDLEPLWQGYTPKYTELSQKVAQKWRGYESLWDTKIKEDRNDVSAYGRRPHYFDPPLQRTVFTRTLLNNPFGVRISRKRKHFYQPILQFWTWKCEFYIVLNNDLPGPGVGLARLDVLNKHRDWCGTVVVDESWGKGRDGQLCDFIALSDARKFTDFECTSWTYTIPKNLEDINWDLYHVMLVENLPDQCVWERKGLGKVLKRGFEPLDESKWAEITLG